MIIFDERRTQRANDVLRWPFKTTGLTKFLGGFLILAAFNTTVPAGSVTLAWNPSPTPSVAGYNILYGGASGAYTSSVNTGSNLTATVTGLTPGLTYYFAIVDYETNGIESVFSNEVTNRLPILPSIIAQPLTQTAIAGTPVTLTVSAGGDPPLSFQWVNGLAPIPGATASLLSWPQVLNGNAGNYTVIVSNPWGSTTSSVATLTVIVPPSILTQPQSQTVIATTVASFSSVASGTVPLSFQWYCGTTAIAGATNSTLAWASVATSNAGNYNFSVSNAGGAVTSSVATLTVIVPPSILTQPQSQTVIATTAASFSSAVTGTAPLSFQWYCGTTAIAGATNSALAWASVVASNAGNYHFTVSNAGGAVTSSVATLMVLPTNTIATAAGAYNGLFFQTNADGTADVTEATAGLLGNCVVAKKGTFSAKVHVGGVSYSLAGVFDIYGDASAPIPRTGAGLSNLTAVLHLDLINGTRQITGTISSMTASNAWIAPLVADLATNAYPQLTGVTLVVSPGLSVNSPTNFGGASGVVVNGVLSLSGALGDTVAISQSVPISKDGYVPLYVSLYKNSGLVEGWINLAGASP
jgi:hypothetical protein